MNLTSSLRRFTVEQVADLHCCQIKLSFNFSMEIGVGVSLFT